MIKSLFTELAHVILLRTSREHMDDVMSVLRKYVDVQYLANRGSKGLIAM